MCKSELALYDVRAFGSAVLLSGALGLGGRTAFLLGLAARFFRGALRFGTGLFTRLCCRNQREGGHGEIFAKVNSLEDFRLIAKLYEASRAGVKIRLLVRGLCCLVPGVAGQSEGVEVRSVVGRFLEHSRVFMFSNNFHPRAFLSSADWMRRNLDRRIELFFEVHQEALKEQLFSLLENYWKDNAKSWVLRPDGTYCRNRGAGPRFSVQDALVNFYQLAR